MSISAPSANATNVNGLSKFDNQCRSVVSHPLALLLIFVYHSTKETSTDLIRIFIPHFREDNLNNDEGELFNNLKKVMIAKVDTSIDVTKMFRESVTDTSNLTEKEIAQSFEKKLKGLKDPKKLPFEVKGQKQVRSEVVGHHHLKDEAIGYVDILVKNRTEDGQSYTPLMIMEVGMNHSEWWTKVDQGTKYLEMMISATEDSQIRFEAPLLIAVATIDRPSHTIRMGVFFCRPVCDNSQFRMTLLWHSTGSFELIGKLFDYVSKFQQLIKIHKESEEQLTTFLNYTYFSSNCCRIGDKVFRCYDSRFRQTNRTQTVYLECPEVTGTCKTEPYFSCIEQYDVVRDGYGYKNDLWTVKANETKELIIISTPYREGTHVAKYPKYFIPIVDHLIALHKAGFLHGDIRAYNTVLHNENAGWLIDFDYGGKISDRPKYPDGYCEALIDGRRIGSSTANEEMLPWHDWYALGHLIFFIHMLKYDTNKMVVNQENLLLIKSFMELEKFWLSLKKDPDTTEIDELKNFLRRDDLNKDESCWIYECQLPSQPTAHAHKTVPGATGSPLKK